MPDVDDDDAALGRADQRVVLDRAAVGVELLAGGEGDGVQPALGVGQLDALALAERPRPRRRAQHGCEPVAGHPRDATGTVRARSGHGWGRPQARTGYRTRVGDAEDQDATRNGAAPGEGGQTADRGAGGAAPTETSAPPSRATPRCIGRPAEQSDWDGGADAPADRRSPPPRRTRRRPARRRPPVPGPARRPRRPPPALRPPPPPTAPPQWAPAATPLRPAPPPSGSTAAACPARGSAAYPLRAPPRRRRSRRRPRRSRRRPQATASGRARAPGRAPGARTRRWPHRRPSRATRRADRSALRASPRPPRRRRSGWPALRPPPPAHPPAGARQRVGGRDAATATTSPTSPASCRRPTRRPTRTARRSSSRAERRAEKKAAKQQAKDDAARTATTERTDQKAEEAGKTEEDGKDGKDGKEGAKPGGHARLRRNLIRLLVVGVIAATAAILLRVFVVQPYYIPSESMEPTLHGCTGCNDDHILVEKVSYRAHDIRTGDIVVFNRPPGDTCRRRC